MDNQQGVAQIQLKDGRVTSGRWDDFEAVGERPTENIVIADAASERIHTMPEEWLRSRVRGWMNITESPNLDFWIGTYTSEGRWISCSSRDNNYVPMMHRVEYARNICRLVNRHCAQGGAWLAGWIRGGHEFYLLWKDPDGDISVPIECDKPFTELMGWKNDVWVMHCNNALKIKREIDEVAEVSPSQQVKLAQGQPMDTEKHLNEAAPQIIL